MLNHVNQEIKVTFSQHAVLDTTEFYSVSPVRKALSLWGDKVVLGNTKLQGLGLQGRGKERGDSKNYTLKRENSNFELTYIRTSYMVRFMQLKEDAGKPCQ